MNVLGLHTLGHDTGAAIVSEQDGEMRIVAISEARLNRRKHASTYPVLAIQYCLDAFGLRLENLDAVYADDLWELARSRTGRQFGLPDESRAASRPLDTYLSDVKRFGYVLEDAVRFSPRFVSHLDAHAASTFYLSGFDDAAVLCLDAGTAVFHGRELQLRCIDKVGYTGPLVRGGEVLDPHFGTLGLSNSVPNSAYLFDAATEALGLSPFDAGKTMALAGYSSRFPRQPVLCIPRNRYLDFMVLHGASIDAIEREVRPFDAANTPGRDALVSAYWVNFARDVQDALEEDVVYMARLAKQRTGARRLCIAGGIGLSCIANRRIHDTGLFEEIFIQPASSDEGIALGCALLGYYQRGGQLRRSMGGSYFGHPHDRAALDSTLRTAGLPARPANHGEVAALLADRRIVARFDGASEFGPRALGNRSILADPRDGRMLERINRDIKRRECFQPFAPSCHADKRERYFDMPMEGPYMIMAAPVRAEARELIPAVTHVDGSSRPQALRAADNPNYYDLIGAFGALTGIYVLLNTSFNGGDEPIVECHHDALLSFLRLGLDYLIIDGQLVARPHDSDRAIQALAERQTRAVRDSYRRSIGALCDPAKLRAALRGVRRASPFQDSEMEECLKLDPSFVEA